MGVNHAYAYGVLEAFPTAEEPSGRGDGNQPRADLDRTDCGVGRVAAGKCEWLTGNGVLRPGGNDAAPSTIP